MSDDASDRVAEFLNIEKEDVPTCRLINLEQDMKKFVPDFKALDAEGIRSFVQTYLDGDLKVGEGFFRS